MRLAWVLLVCLAAHAQTGVLVGAVIDPLREPIVAARVVLIRADEKTEIATDQRGEFRIEKVASGTYDLEVQVPGFRIQRLKSILISGDQTLQLPPIPLFLGMTCGGHATWSIRPLTDAQKGAIIGRMVIERKDSNLPLPNAVITLRANGRTVTGSTDKNGRYRIEAPDGDYAVRVGGYSPDKLTFLRGWEIDYEDTIVDHDHPTICE